MSQCYICLCHIYLDLLLHRFLKFSFRFHSNSLSNRKKITILMCLIKSLNVSLCRMLMKCIRKIFCDTLGRIVSRYWLYLQHQYFQHLQENNLKEILHKQQKWVIFGEILAKYLQFSNRYGLLLPRCYYDIKLL
jgi:hypothetical protein